MDLTDLLALCHVPRWSIVPHLREQSVAEHSFRVAVIANDLAGRINSDVDLGKMLGWALIHDAPECRSGDIPPTYKNHDHDDECLWYAEVKHKVSPEIRRIVKLADRIEAYTFIKRYGIGPHASLVAEEIWRDIMESPVSDTTKFAAMDICGDILCEKGRYQPK